MSLLETRELTLWWQDLVDHRKALKLVDLSKIQVSSLWVVNILMAVVAGAQDLQDLSGTDWVLGYDVNTDVVDSLLDYGVEDTQEAYQIPQLHLRCAFK